MQMKKRWNLVYACAAVGLAVLSFSAGALWQSHVTPPPAEVLDGNFDIDTRGGAEIYWNGNPLTVQADGKAAAEQAALSAVPTLSTKGQPDAPPQDSLYIGRYEKHLQMKNARFTGGDASASAAAVEPLAQTGDPYTNVVAVGEEVAILWQSDFLPSSFARDGKHITSLSFSGLTDEELVSVSYDGVIIRPTTAGERTLLCDVEDSGGVVTHAGVLLDVR